MRGSELMFVVALGLACSGAEGPRAEVGSDTAANDGVQAIADTPSDTSRTDAPECEAGCVPACEAETSWCRDNGLWKCDAGEPTFVEACAPGTSCTAAAGVASCEGSRCTPGERVCLGGVVSQCDPAGRTLVPVDDCGAAGAVCAAGACTPLVCAPGESHCSTDGRSIVRCDLFGLVATESACAADATCVVTGGTATCREAICVPGTVFCDGEDVVQCHASGTAFASSVACDSGSLCLDGACVPRVCLSALPECAAGAIIRCAPDGVGTTTETCDGACVDLRSDPLHCGECGRACGADEACQSGECRDASPATGCVTCPCSRCAGGACCILPRLEVQYCLDAERCP